MVELEFLVNDVNNGMVKDLSLRDLLVFITGSDVIPPFGFQKRLMYILRKAISQLNLQHVL